MPTYTAPTTRATGYLVTAANWNAELVENLKYFKDAPVFDVAAIIGAATTAGVRLDLETGALAVREGDDSAYASLLADEIYASAGTVSAPSFAVTTDTNTGIYFPAADTIAITGGGVERLRLSGDDVAMNATGKFYLDGAAATGNTYLSEIAADTVAVFTGGTERLRFTSGAVIIVGSGDGTASVAAQTLRGAAAAGTNIAGANLTIDASNGTGTGGSGAIIFRTAPTAAGGSSANTLADRLRIVAGGDIVIGNGEATATVTAGTIRGANAAGTNLTLTAPTILQAGLGTGSGYSSRIDFRLGAQGSSGTTQNTARTVLRVTHGGLYITPSPSDMDSPVGGSFVTDAPQGGSGTITAYSNFGTNVNSLAFVTRAAANSTARILSSGIEWSTGGGLAAVIQVNSNDPLSVRVNQGNPNVQLNENLRFLTTQDNGMQTGKKLFMDGCAGTGDTFIVESSANILTLAHGTGGAIQIGPGTGTATPGAATLAGASGTGTNIAGGALTIDAGNGTGTGGSGAVAIRTAAAGASGSTANTLTTRVTVSNVGNVGVGTATFGTSAAGVLSIASGTEPTTGPADTVQFYSVDRSAGNTIPAVYCEGSGVTNAGITSTTVTHKIAMKVNGTVYYLLATTNAT